MELEAKLKESKGPVENAGAVIILSANEVCYENKVAVQNIDSCNTAKPVSTGNMQKFSGIVGRWPTMSDLEIVRKRSDKNVK